MQDFDGNGKRLLVTLERGVNMDRKPVDVINRICDLEHPKEWIKNQIGGGKEFVFYDEKRANAFLQTYGYLASVGDGIRSLDDIVARNESGSKVKFSLKPTEDVCTGFCNLRRRRRHGGHAAVRGWREEGPCSLPISYG